MQGLEGLLKCYDHNVSFNDPEEMEQHKADEVHTYGGTAPCQDCGAKNQEINFTGKLEKGKLPPAICKECELAYIEELKKKGLIK